MSSPQTNEDYLRISDGLGKPKLGKVSSLENEIGMNDDGSRQSGLLSPNNIPRLNIPQFNANVSEREKMLYLKKIEELGSLDHITSLQSMEKTYKENEKEMQKLEV